MATIPSTSLAASASVTIDGDDLHGIQNYPLFGISIVGSGTAKVEFKHLDQPTFTEQATGLSGDYSVYVGGDVTKIKITETGGANPITYAVSGLHG